MEFGIQVALEVEVKLGVQVGPRVQVALGAEVKPYNSTLELTLTLELKFDLVF